MDSNLQKEFAMLYPKEEIKNKTSIDKLNSNNTNSSKTSSSTQKNISTTTSSDKKSSLLGKLFIILFIAILGALLFSTPSYTLADKLFKSLNLFNQHGEPGILIILIYTIIFALLIWLILAIFYRS
jgi:uncharacterized BrkB/YihY/UPF0761 family membrane protein